MTIDQIAAAIDRDLERGNDAELLVGCQRAAWKLHRRRRPATVIAVVRRLDARVVAAFAMDALGVSRALASSQTALDRQAVGGVACPCLTLLPDPWVGFYRDPARVLD